MIRVVFVLGVLAITTPASAEDWSIRSPEGWTRSDGSFESELAGPGRRFTSPGGDELVIVKRELSVSPRSMVEQIFALAALDRTMHVDKQDITVRDGEVRGEMTLSSPERLRQLRALAAIDNDDRMTDVVLARCTSSAGGAPGCAETLASLKLETKPATTIDTDNAFVRPAKWIFGAIVVVSFMFGGLRYVLRRRAMNKRTSLTDGEVVTLTGRVRASSETVTAPLSGTSCVLHRSRMYIGDAKEAVTEGARFVVVTATGEVLVDATPTIDLVPSPVVPRQEKRELAFMANRGVPSARHRDAGFDEIVIAPGATIVIRGVIRIERDHAASGERGYRDDAPTTTRLVGTETEPLTIKKTW